MKKQELLKVAKPILFNTEMVQAILEDRKTVIRRVLKPKLRDGEYGCHIWFNKTLNRHIIEKYDEDESDFTPTRYVNQPYEVGDILYVRETYSYVYQYGSEENLKWEIKKYIYKSDGYVNYDVFNHSTCEWETAYKWRPSIHMPKEAARIFLKVTNVRVERLQDVTPRGAIKEGCNGKYNYDEYDSSESIRMFVDLWNSTINKQDLDNYGWDANPWVWVIEFERVEVEV